MEDKLSFVNLVKNSSLNSSLQFRRKLLFVRIVEEHREELVNSLKQYQRKLVKEKLKFEDFNVRSALVQEDLPNQLVLRENKLFNTDPQIQDINLQIDVLKVHLAQALSYHDGVRSNLPPNKRRKAIEALEKTEDDLSDNDEPKDLMRKFVRDDIIDSFLAASRDIINQERMIHFH
ncbi:hypothetical protein SNEBB_010110 [Seison nebaliae]|nr:hypothetical protein SNEBB_010110 [Seison nebaliae]